MKFLLWALIIGAVVLFVLHTRRAVGGTRKQARPQVEAEPMVPCAHCGVHLPQSEALAGEDGKLYCSDTHRRLDGSGSDRA